MSYLPKIKCVTLVNLLVVSTLSVSAQAQTSDVITTTPVSTSALSTQGCLRLNDVFELAAERDPGVLIAQAGEQEADANIEEAKSLTRPRIDAVGRTGVGNTGIVDSGVSNSIGFRASQRLLDFGDAKFARRSANADFSASQIDTHQARLDAATQAGFAVLEFREAEAQLSLTRERRDYFARQLTSVDLLLERGGATRTERASVASQLAEAEGFVLELEFRRDRARTQIEIATRARSPLCAASEFQPLVDSERYLVAEEAVDVALNSNLSLQGLRNRAEGEQARARREARARLPIINVVATGAYSSLGGFDTFEFRDRVGIDVSVPLFSGNALSARKQRASAREVAARARVFDQEQQIREDVSITWQRIRSLKRQLETQREVERQKLLQFEAAEIEAGAGTITLRDLIELRLEFEESGLSRIRTKFDLQRQEIVLASLVGTLA